MNSCIRATSSQNYTFYNSDLALCSQKDICILLLIGIPASGKSYFRLFLEKYFEINSKSVLGTVQVFSISYDDFCKVRNPTQFTDKFSWKEERSEVVQAVENVIKQLKNEPQANGTALNNLVVTNSKINNPDTVLFIIDDNMYYRSMRHEYYKLSRSYNLSFCQIFFHATLQDALKYNKQREPHSEVPEFVIKKMFERIEPPDEAVSWEKQSLVLKAYIDFERESVLESILSLIKTSLSCPSQPNLGSIDSEQSQQINNSNAIHQIDIALKKLVGDLIKRRIKESNGNPGKVSQHFSEKRLVILKEIKERKIVLPVDLSAPVSKNDIDSIIPILSELLDSS